MKTKNYYNESKKVMLIVLLLNLFVLIIKIIAGVMTRSLSILSDAIHSASDTLNNVVGLFVMKYANEPPDKKHPYGHGKFETLGAFAIVIFLAIAGVEVIKGAIDRLLHPVELPLFKKEIVYLLILTLIVNIFVWLYERAKGKELKSDFLIADSSHTASDVLITVMVLASQFFIEKKMYVVDPILALVIAFFIGKAAYEIISSTVPVLVDEAWIDESKIKETVLSINGVRDCYEVFSRKSPQLSYIECTIKVIPEDLYGAHKIADLVEDALKNTFGECKITVHLEP